MSDARSRREAVPRADGFRRAAEAYLDGLRQEGRSRKTLEGYEDAIGRAHGILAQAGVPPCPSRLTSEQVRAIERGFAGNPWLLRTLSVCLRGMGCREPVRYVIPPRHRVRWLSDYQADVVLGTALGLGPPWSTVIHLELENGFRRVSVSRARVDDFKSNPVYVRGKGKDYTIWPHPRLPEVLRDTMTWRRERGLDSYTWLLPAVSSKCRTIGPYSENGLDVVLAKVALESGVKFSHHDLRRTFGRAHWKAGTKIETIASMLGHESVDQTIAYLGINLDDMAEAMQRLQEYRSAPKVYLTTTRSMERTTRVG